MTSYTAAYGTTTALRPVRGDSPGDLLPRPGSVFHRLIHETSANVPFARPGACPYWADDL